MLGQAHYACYDETTASQLRGLANEMNGEYDGKVSNIVAARRGA